MSMLSWSGTGTSDLGEMKTRTPHEEAPRSQPRHLERRAEAAWLSVERTESSANLSHRENELVRELYSNSRNRCTGRATLTRITEQIDVSETCAK